MTTEGEDAWPDSIPGEEDTEESDEEGEQGFTETEYFRSQAAILSEKTQRELNETSIHGSVESLSESLHDEGNGTMSTDGCSTGQVSPADIMTPIHHNELQKASSSKCDVDLTKEENDGEKLEKVESLVKELYPADSVESFELLGAISKLRHKDHSMEGSGTKQTPDGEDSLQQEREDSQSKPRACCTVL